MRRAAAALAACLLVSPVCAKDWPLELLHGSGSPATRFHIMIAAEGYTRAELGKFRDDAKRIAGELMTKEPYRTWGDAVLISRVDVESNDSGISSEANQLDRDTYFRTRFGQNQDDTGKWVDNHYCFPRDEAGEKAARELNQGTRRDALVLLMNDPRHGGAAARGIIANTASPEAASTLYHELGHVVGLHDEYDGNGAPPAAEFTNPNVTLIGDPAAVKWNAWKRSRPAIGCYVGGAHSTAGVFRPAWTCVMRDVNAAPCEICLETMYNGIMARSPLIEWHAPAVDQLVVIQGEAVGLSAEVLQPRGNGMAAGSLSASDSAPFQVLWFVDGQRVQASETGGRVDHALQTAGLAVGRHTVTLVVRDYSRFLCPDGWQRYAERAVRWQVDVQLAPGHVPVPQANQAI